MSILRAIAIGSHGCYGGGYPLLAVTDVRAGVDRGDGEEGTVIPFVTSSITISDLGHTQAPIETMRAMLANCEQFRSWAGVSTAEDALDRAGYNHDAAPFTYPCAMVFPGDNNSEKFDNGGSCVVSFYQEVSNYAPAEDEEELKERDKIRLFDNRIDAILRELDGLRNSGSGLAYHSRSRTPDGQTSRYPAENSEDLFMRFETFQW